MEIFSALLDICAGNSPVKCVGNSPVTGKFPTHRPVTRSLMFSLICAWINGWINNTDAGDLRRYHVHYDVIVTQWSQTESPRKGPGINNIGVFFVVSLNKLPNEQLICPNLRRHKTYVRHWCGYPICTAAFKFEVTHRSLSANKMV